MAILVQDVVDRMRAALDAEGAEHYSDTLDLIPAINNSVVWLVSVINSTLGHKKLGEEIFRELTESDVFKTSINSRVSLSVFPSAPWTILAVYPKPTTADTGAATPPAVDDKESQHLPNKYHQSSDYSAKRLTLEEWSVNKNNPFEAGNSITLTTCPEIISYAYLDPSNYDPSSSITITKELEVRPPVPQQELTIFYVKKPTDVALVTDTIPFPDTVFPLILDKSLQYVAYKQGDQTTLYSVTGQDIKQLLMTVL